MFAQDPPSQENIDDSPIGVVLTSPYGFTREDFERVQREYEHRQTPGTRNLYRKQWTYFCDWCAQEGLPPLPADPFTVASYLVARADVVTIATLRTASAAIRSYHHENGYPSPVSNPTVRAIMQELSRQYPRPPQQVTGINLHKFAAIAARADLRKLGESPGDAQRRASMDIALVALMRDAMLRRSEAAAARWGHLQREPDDGTGRLTIPLSKTGQSGTSDQSGQGDQSDHTGTSVVLFVSAMTMELLDTMCHYRSVKSPSPEDTIFGIGERQIANRIKGAAAHAGLEGRYGGNSPRIGMAIDLASDDVELTSMMQAGRWSTAEMAARYIRGIAAGEGAVARWHQRHGYAIRVRTHGAGDYR